MITAVKKNENNNSKTKLLHRQKTERKKNYARVEINPNSLFGKEIAAGHRLGLFLNAFS